MEYKWTVLTVTTVGILMAGIDSRIVIVGIPQVASALNGDAEQAIWFTQAYVLGSTVALLLIGRVSDIFGRVRLYTTGFAIFTIGSLLTSLSQTPNEVILFRGIQGLGAAILFTNSVTMITDATPSTELGFALGLNQVAFRFGAMAGLTLSGLILSYLDWRALFYINVPIGIFGTLWAKRRLREIAKVERQAPIDWLGFLLFTTSITSFLLALTFSVYGLQLLLLVDILFLVSLLSLSIFVVHATTTPSPLLDLRLLRIREFTGGVVAQFINAVAWGAVLLLVSLYFQLVVGLTPFEAGLRVIPFELSFLAFGPLSGKLSDKFGNFAFTTAGITLTSLSLYLFSTVDISTPYSQIILYLIILGAGIGVFSSPNISSIMGSVPPHRRGIASAFRATFFEVGFTISLTLVIVILTFTVPYASVTKIIATPNTVIPEAQKVLFAEGLKNTYRWLALLNTVALIPSTLRGKRPTHTPSDQDVLAASVNPESGAVH